MLKAFLDMLGAAFAVIRKLGGTALAIAALVPVCIGGWLWQSIRLDLWSGPASTVAWFALMWTLVWVCTAALIVRPTKVAASLCTVMLLILGAQTIAHLAPGTAEAARTVAVYQDRKNLAAAQRHIIETQEPFACNQDTWEKTVFFGRDGNTGTRVPLVWVDLTPGHVDCYREPGVDPRFGRELVPVTNEVVRAIGRQEPPVRPEPVRPAPVPVVIIQAPAPQMVAPSEPVLGPHTPLPPA